MLKLGDIVQGKMIEAIDQNHWIVSFDGKLQQVKNTTSLQFKENKIVRLKIIKENPLELKVLFSREFPKRSLDLKI